MILLSITNYGWVTIALAGLSIVVAIKVLQRMSSNRNSGFISIGFVALIVFILLSLSLSLGNFLGRFVAKTIRLPKYEAKIVDYTTHQSSGSGGRRSSTMFTPVVSFTTHKGIPLKIATDISSGGRPVTGELITIGYEEGMTTAEEFTGSKYLLIGGACTMLLIMGYFCIVGIAYAMGAEMRVYFSIGINLLLYVIFPIGLMFFLGAVGYALFLYFTGQKPNMPGWAVGVCIFFLIMLFLGFISYLQMLYKRISAPRF
ncbi:hypothetical protein [Pedobacter caeni]|uniref:Uncharacterized protein n=1 Tax=Pedobacter caeni TaxID=288992 RepID=A0A1M4W383_9SPHI|nr:hypothetical protein [Pedobacter caeni]SHE75600.1 hypothetical protein SAMN04488522_1011114 [Pedobacter caeni]